MIFVPYSTVNLANRAFIMLLPVTLRFEHDLGVAQTSNRPVTPRVGVTPVTSAVQGPQVAAFLKRLKPTVLVRLLYSCNLCLAPIQDQECKLYRVRPVLLFSNLGFMLPSSLSLLFYSIHLKTSGSA